MFNIFSLQHVFVLTLIALVVVGPKDLPQLVSLMVKAVAKGRSMAFSLRRNLEELTRTADLDGLRAELNALKRRYPLSSLEAGMARSNDRASRG